MHYWRRLLLTLMSLLAAVLYSVSLQAEDSVELPPDVVVVVMTARGDSPQLTRSQVTDIFLGRLRHLPNGRQVIPVDLDEDPELRNRFYLEVLERTPAQMRAHWARLVFTGRGSPPRSVGSVEELGLAITNDPRVIGYVQRRDLTTAMTVVYE